MMICCLTQWFDLVFKIQRKKILAKENIKASILLCIIDKMSESSIHFLIIYSDEFGKDFHFEFQNTRLDEFTVQSNEVGCKLYE